MGIEILLTGTFTGRARSIRSHIRHHGRKQTPHRSRVVDYASPDSIPPPQCERPTAAAFAAINHQPSTINSSSTLLPLSRSPIRLSRFDTPPQFESPPPVAFSPSTISHQPSTPVRYPSRCRVRKYASRTHKVGLHATGARRRGRPSGKRYPVSTSTRAVPYLHCCRAAGPLPNAPPASPA